jgi:hypothetical protein
MIKLVYVDLPPQKLNALPVGSVADTVLRIAIVPFGDHIVDGDVEARQSLPRLADELSEG